MLLSELCKVVLLDYLLYLIVQLIVALFVLQRALVQLLLETLPLYATVRQVVQLGQLVVIELLESLPEQFHDLAGLFLALIDALDDLGLSIPVLDLVAGGQLFIQ